MQLVKKRSEKILSKLISINVYLNIHHRYLKFKSFTILDSVTYFSKHSPAQKP